MDPINRSLVITEMSAVLNRAGLDNELRTPDYILAEFIVSTLEGMIHMNSRTRVHKSPFAPLGATAHRPDGEADFVPQIKDAVHTVLENRDRVLTLLEDYSKFLEKEGYLDIDWRAEEPTAINEFLKTHGTPNLNKP